MGIADWPASERPRERLLRQGAAALSDAELLAIFLRTGRRGRSAVDLGRDVLEQVGGLHRLMAADRKQLCAIGGLGEAKFAQLQAAFELTRRALATTLEASNSLTRPDAVHEYLQLVIGAQPHEVFMVVFLDTQHRVLAAEELFRGTLAQTSVYPREVVKRALAVNCAAVILAHNHPSGLAEPSAADRALTQALKSALGLIDVRVLDHLVVAGGRVFSFAANGLL